WGLSHPEAWEQTMSSSFFNQAQGTMTSVFHNTAYRFRTAFYKMTGVNNRDAFLANLVISMPSAFFGHDKLKGNTTNAYDRNILVGPAKNVYSFWQGDKFETLDAFKSFLGAQNMLATAVGVRADGPVVVNAEARDLRPRPGSPAIGNGVKVFAPWGLYAVTGEWNFRRYPAHPARLVGENLFISSEHKKGGAEFNEFPRNDLVADGATTADYEQGTLEDWVDGALKFDGNRVAVQEKLDRQYEVTDLDMRENNFLIEGVFRIEGNAADAQVAGKLSDAAGYALRVKGGKVGLVVRSGGMDAEVTGPALEAGRWYHVIGEADRTAGVLRVYVDGKLAAEAPAALDAAASLASDAEFTVGRGLVGAIDFLRVSRGSLADAKTTIGELYAWEFDGPHLRDFAGRAPARGGRRTIGALEPAGR
ncbi:MAG TPA: LamG-like jellyroll fold domain-containing protein, partial [Tepidisphaeraceae bacterium]|nr:LamG-like jellyroll fold domain-containing protein [Tepidisphaeraceae bacterium]